MSAGRVEASRDTEVSASRPISRKPPLSFAWSTYRSTSLIRNSPPPLDHHRALGIFLLKEVSGLRFRIW